MKNRILTSVVIMCVGMAFSIDVFAAEYCTFESIYKDSNNIAWIIAGICTVIGLAVIFFTGGSTSPIVLGIGTWIGNMMGLTGIAATNAGLALLGGGSIASGGYGIAGGIAILSVALTFGEEIVLDYTVGKVVAEYQYSKFAEQSKSMTTLPVPRNDDGSKSYEAAVVFLENNINDEEPIFSNYNQDVINNAIRVIDETSDATFFSDDIKEGDIAKKESLYAILYFLSNEYNLAKSHAMEAIVYARKADRRRTLPAFVYASSSLYDKEFDFKGITHDYFRYSIMAEPNNPIIPLLFAVYLDRVMYRFNDNYLPASSLRLVSDIAYEESLRAHVSINIPIILARYFVRLKIEQQKISSLGLTDNETIKNNRKTLNTIKKSMSEYSILLRDAGMLINNFLYGEIELDDESHEKGVELLQLLDRYHSDTERLVEIIANLENYQSATPDDVIIESSANNNKIFLWIFLAFVVLVLIFSRKKIKIRAKAKD